MITVIHFIIAFTASAAGAISGIGGGIIIKPVLDSVGFFDIAVINFLSGCTVLTMTAFTLLRSRKSAVSINRRIGSFIAAGGIIGGLGGKYLFNLMLAAVENERLVLLTQSSILLVLTAGVLAFTLLKKRVRPFNIESSVFCIFTGLLLGATGAFLGIGGGPINLVVFYLFFSMDSKTAALNSIFVIFFSQLTSLVLTLISGTVPDVELPVLILMMAGGASGAVAGSHLSMRISHGGVDRLFIGVLAVLVLICIYNIAGVQV